MILDLFVLLFASVLASVLYLAVWLWVTFLELIRRHVTRSFVRGLRRRVFR